MDVQKISKLITALNNNISNSLIKNTKKSSFDINNLLKFADSENILEKKLNIIKLIDSYIQKITKLVEEGNINEAKEYVISIRPEGWELNRESTMDKAYEQVVRGLSKKLNPEDYKALGL